MEPGTDNGRPAGSAKRDELGRLPRQNAYLAFGMSRRDLIGKKIDFVPEKSWPETEKAIARMMEGKEIADLLCLSKNTILFHRQNARGKLGLKNRKVNLRTHLLTSD